MNCKHCGYQVGDDATFCPQCGAPINAEQTAETVDYTQASPENTGNGNVYEQPQQNAQPQQQYSQPYGTQPPYGQANPYGQQPPYGQQNPYGQQPPYGQPGYPNIDYAKDENSAKTLGIVAIIVGLFIPLVGWICGGVGKSKLGKIPPEYRSDKYSTANGLCIAGIIVGCLSFVIALVINMASASVISGM